MAGNSLEEYQRNQSLRITREITRQCQEHEQKMQINAQKKWENAHQKLVNLFRSMDAEYSDSCEKCNHPLEKFEDDDLAYLIHIRLRGVHGDASKKDKQDETIELKRSLDELCQKNVELEQRLLILQQTNTRIQAEREAIEAHMTALRQVQKEGVIQNTQTETPKSNIPVNLHHLVPVPDWMITWRESKVFEKTWAAILVMGETGMALRPSIIKMMAKRLSLSEENGYLNDALNYLITPDEEVYPALIEEMDGTPKEGSSSGGNPPDVLRLTKDGKGAYQALTGQAPAENEYDKLIRSHASPEHTILNIQAGEILANEGYQIRGKAQAINLPNGETYIPDIIAADPKTGEVIFIEVERGLPKERISRKAKWIKLYEASNGNLYVFCDNLSCQRSIQGEINLALGGLAYNSFLTNLFGLRQGKRSENDDSIWLSQRRGK
jgi:hypothetical protein